jgi:hypothetical protein
MRAPEDHIVYLPLVQLAYAREGTFDGGSSQIVRARIRQASSPCFANRGPNGTYNHCFLHDDQFLKGLPLLNV